MSDNDLREHIALWLDGRLNEDGSKVLQQELLESATARLLYRRYAHLDAALREMADTSGMMSASPIAPNSAEQLTSDSVGTPATPLADARGAHPMVTLPPTRSNGRRPAIFERGASWYATIAVGMLLAVTLFGYVGSKVWLAAPSTQLASSEAAGKLEEEGLDRTRDLPRKPPAPVATLSVAKQAVWEDSQRAIGQAFFEGETIHLEQGETRISVGFGAEIVASAPYSLTFVSSDRVQLHHGIVAVDVAPWAKGFTVVTEDMDVVDLGTTFTVSATPGEKSETRVFKGVVRVHASRMHSGKRRGVLISEGQQASIGESGVVRAAQLPEVRELLSDLDFGVAKRYRPVTLHNSGAGISVGDEDQHWQVVAGPEESVSRPQFASVCVPHPSYLPNDPETSQWVSIANWQTAKANSTYTFRTEFELEGYDLSTMKLFGRFLADNGISGVRVNGQPVQVESWVDNVKFQPFGDPQFRFVNVTEGLVRGRNVIEIDVRNGMQRKWNEEEMQAKLSPIPNPMAVRVEWYAFGRHIGLASGNARGQQLGGSSQAPTAVITRPDVVSAITRHKG